MTWYSDLLHAQATSETLPSRADFDSEPYEHNDVEESSLALYLAGWLLHFVVLIKILRPPAACSSHKRKETLVHSLVLCRAANQAKICYLLIPTCPWSTAKWSSAPAPRSRVGNHHSEVSDSISFQRWRSPNRIASTYCIFWPAVRVNEIKKYAV